MQEFIVRRLNRELQLEPSQVKQLRIIVMETHDEIRKVRQQIKPQIEEILARSQNRVRAILNPVQLEKHEKFIAECNKRRMHRE